MKEKSCEPGLGLFFFFWLLQQSSPVAVTEPFHLCSAAFSCRRWISVSSKSRKLGRGKSWILCNSSYFFIIIIIGYLFIYFSGHSRCGYFYLGSIKSAGVFSPTWGCSAAQLVPARELVLWSFLCTFPHSSFPYLEGLHSLPISVSTGLQCAPKKLHLPLTLSAFGPVELLHVISSINKSLFLFVTSCSW